MAIALLDINDSNLQLWRNGECLRSPGYALLDGSQYQFGNAARGAARLRPRDINTRFWWQLSVDPLQPALGPARHSADLVHAHLLDIHRQASDCSEVLLAVPGSMQRGQLALLLGIVQESPFTAVGLVNRSAALASLHPANGRIFHLEVQLHQGVISELTQTDGQTELRRTTPLPGCGLLQLQERLIEAIASAFIRQTRFDPRRKAQTEQDLYDQLPDALRAIESGHESNMEIGGYQARIERGELLQAGDRLFKALTDAIGTAGADDRVLVDPIATLLPGLGERVPAREVIASDALWRATLRHEPRLVQREQALNLVTTLPTEAEYGPAGTAAAPESPTPPAEVIDRAAEPVAPTHLLREGTARPLRAGGVDIVGGAQLYQQAGRWLLRGDHAASVQVNDQPYRAEQALGRGDTLRIDDFHGTLIEVL